MKNSKTVKISQNVTTGKENFKNENPFKIKEKKGVIRLLFTKR